MKIKLLFSIFMLFISSFEAQAVIIPGWLDWNGNPVHTEDEVDVQIDASVVKVTQGYRYTYTLTSMQSSKQNIGIFKVYLPDPYTSVVGGTESSPWGPHSRGWYPYTPYARPSQAVPLGFVYPKEYWRISWVAFRDVYEIQPGMSATGFTFVSPFPPGIGEAYIQGYSHPPVQRVGGTPLGEEESMPIEWTQRSKYGTGKVVPTIAPVKPTTPNVTDNYSVIGCTGGICDVQLDITGPQDPYGTAYTYTWSGAFGTATGAKPIVQLAAGAYTVSVAVSDPYATLVTATMPITVIDPNPPVVVNPPAGGGNQGGGQGNAGGGNATGGNGNAGGGNAGTIGNDMDHDGISDERDDDRDGDGKPNDKDAAPDHPD
ncbi:MAG: hypothetical protein R8L58_01990 [Mariprofundaceae bacterium]